jgi:hypothetical protein
MNQQGVISSISIGAAYSEAASFLRREKRLIAPLVLAFLVLPMALSQLLQPAAPLAPAEGMSSWMLVALVALMIQLAGQMAVSRLAMGWTGSLGEAVRLALRRLPAAIGAVLLYFLALSLLLVPAVTVLLLLAGGGQPGAGSLRGINAVMVVAMFIVIPRLVLVPPFAMAEPGGPWALVKRTWKASSGHFWRLLGFFLIFLIASLILALAVSAVVGSLVALTLGSAEPLSLGRLFIALAGGLVQGLAGTLYAAMVGRITVQLLAGSIKGT